ncbi:MAG: thiolase family protein [Halobacteria archaeon]
MRDVAIAGIGQTRHGKREDVSIPELVSEAVRECLRDARATPREVDAVVSGNMEWFEGLLMPDLVAVDALASVMKPAMKVQTGGTVGASVFLSAYYHVASGLFDRVLAVGFEKITDCIHAQAGLSLGDPVYGRFASSGVLGSSALQLRRYMWKYGLTEKQVAHVAAKNRTNALRNPKAHMRQATTVEQVLASPVMAHPIRLLHSCPQTDGACALLLASEDAAREMRDDPVRVLGTASASDTPRHSDRDMAEAASLAEAGRRAFKKAGVENPRKFFQVAELYDAFAHQEVIWSEVLGLFPRGKGGVAAEEGITSMEGDLPFNPSGGVLSTNPIGATAMIRIAEAALQVRGDAGEHQVPGVERALAHGWGGGLPQFNVVTVLGR